MRDGPTPRSRAIATTDRDVSGDRTAVEVGRCVVDVGLPPLSELPQAAAIRKAEARAGKRAGRRDNFSNKGSGQVVE
jgi:hypothetical protein